MSGRLRLKEPAGGLRLRERGAGRQQSKVRNGGRSDEHDGENVGVLLVLGRHVENERNRHAGRDLGGDRAADESAEIVEGHLLVGDHLDRAGHHQPAGGAEKAADHRIRNKADGAPCAREAEHPKDCSGDRGGQRQRDEGWAEQPRAAMGEQIVRQGSHERRQHHGDGTVRAGDRKRQRTAPGDDRGTNGGRKERHRYAVGERVFERPGEDERSVGQGIGDRQHTADRAGKHVRQGGAELWATERAVRSG